VSRIADERCVVLLRLVYVNHTRYTKPSKLASSISMHFGYSLEMYKFIEWVILVRFEINSHHECLGESNCHYRSLPFLFFCVCDLFLAETEGTETEGVCSKRSIQVTKR